MEKICIKNKYKYQTIKNKEYGIRIIKYLEKLGGINKLNYTGTSTHNIAYYINSNNTITWKDGIPNGYKEIDLDNLTPIEPTTDNLKECFIKIMDEINKLNSSL